MQTSTHLLIAAAVFARPGRRWRNRSALLGGAAPDLSLFALFLYEGLVLGVSAGALFNERYFSDDWQSVFAVDNSIPLICLVFLLGVALRQAWLWALAGGAMLHVLVDFCVHHHDARAHFWPLSDWVFNSPLSYWDPDHYGWLVMPLELTLAGLLAFCLWRRFRGGRTADAPAQRPAQKVANLDPAAT